MIWGFADAWGFGFAWMAWLFAGFASLRSGMAGALSCLVWLCPVVAIWLRSLLCAFGSWFRLGHGFAAICFVWSWLRFGMAWLCLGFVVAQCLRFASAYVWRFGSGNAWRFTICLGFGAALSVPGSLRSCLLCAWLCRGSKVFYSGLPALLSCFEKSFEKVLARHRQR